MTHQELARKVADDAHLIRELSFHGSICFEVLRRDHSNSGIGNVGRRVAWDRASSPPWDFVEFCDLYEIESDFAAKVESRFDKVIEVAAPTTAP